MQAKCLDIRPEMAAAEGAMESESLMEASQGGEPYEPYIDGGSPLSGVAVAISTLLWIGIAVLLWKLI